MVRRGIVATVKLKRSKKPTLAMKIKRRAAPIVGVAGGYIAGSGVARSIVASGGYPYRANIMTATIGGGLVATYTARTLIRRHRRMQRVTKIRMEMARRRKIKGIKKKIKGMF